MEAINVTLNLMQYHFLDRDLQRTGQSIVVISPGCGVFEVNKGLAEITYQRMMDNGIGSDMLSLGLPPLHIAPFFLYNVSKNAEEYFHHQNSSNRSMLCVAHRMNITQSKHMELTLARHTMKFHIGCTFHS